MDTETERETQREEGHMKMDAEDGVSLLHPRNAKDCWNHKKLRKGKILS